MLEEDLRADPTQALPELVDLIGRMLVENGYSFADPSASPDPEIVGEFLQAREVVAAIASGNDAELGDAADAIQRLMRVYDYLAAQRAP